MTHPEFSTPSLMTTKRKTNPSQMSLYLYNKMNKHHRHKDDEQMKVVYKKSPSWFECIGKKTNAFC